MPQVYLLSCPDCHLGTALLLEKRGNRGEKKSGKLEDKGKTVCVQMGMWLVGNSSWREQHKSSMHREVTLSCSMFVWIWKMFLV